MSGGSTEASLEVTCLTLGRFCRVKRDETYCWNRKWLSYQKTGIPMMDRTHAVKREITNKSWITCQEETSMIFYPSILVERHLCRSQKGLWISNNQKVIVSLIDWALRQTFGILSCAGEYEELFLHCRCCLSLMRERCSFCDGCAWCCRRCCLSCGPECFRP